MIDVMSYLITAFYVYLVITIAFLLLDNRESTSTIAWLLVLILFPFVGIIFYLLIGRNWRHFSKKNKPLKQMIERRLHPFFFAIMKKQQQIVKKLEHKKTRSYKKKLLELLRSNSNSLLTTNNTLTIFHQGKDKFSQLIKDLRRAELFIHMEYFIWRSDTLTEEIKDILIQKALQGVEVRVLLDPVGCFFLKKRYVHELRDAGVQVYSYFNFMSLFKAHTINYRNHRKIIVIDGKIGYTGGMNMAEEYATGGKRFKHWRDTHVRLEGEGVHLLQRVFTMSWYLTTNEALVYPEYFPKVTARHRQLPIQVSTSGPDSEWESIQQLYFTLINAAAKKVYIQTPYFIPDNTVYMALKTAALSGVDVRIMLTGVPDKYIPYWSAFTYFKHLLKAGVKIYHYKRGFMHAKTVMIDDEICAVGTANVDIRSFQLNYELMTLIYDKKTTHALGKQFSYDMYHSKPFTLKHYENMNKLVKLRNSAARLLAPLL